MKKGFTGFLNEFMGGHESLLAANSGHALMVMSFPGAFCAAEKESEPAPVCACPKCGSEAIYRYGRAWTGKQRFLCLICGRQFTGHHSIPAQRPGCPKCGSEMHVYKKEKKCVRFRCASYPECKTFVKINIEDEEK